MPELDVWTEYPKWQHELSCTWPWSAFASPKFPSSKYPGADERCQFSAQHHVLPDQKCRLLFERRHCHRKLWNERKIINTQWSTIYVALCPMSKKVEKFSRIKAPFFGRPILLHFAEHTRLALHSGNSMLITKRVSSEWLMYRTKQFQWLEIRAARILQRQNTVWLWHTDCKQML